MPSWDPDVVDAVTRGVQLEASDPVGVRRILGVQDVVAAPGGKGQDVALGHEHVVDAAAHLVVVARDDLHPVRGVLDIEHDQAVLPVRGSLAADDRELPVRRDLDVVDRAGVHPDGVHQVDARRIADVPEVGVPVGAPGPGDRVVTSVDAFPDPQIRSVPVADRPAAHDLPVLLHVAGSSADRLPRGEGAPGDNDGVEPRTLGHEGAVRLHEGGRTGRHQGVGRAGGDRVLQGIVRDLVAARVEGAGAEPDHVAGPRLVFARGDVKTNRRIGAHRDRGVAAYRFGARRDRRGAFAVEHEHAVLADGRHRRVARGPLEAGLALSAGSILGESADPERSAGVEVCRERRDLDAREGRPRNPHRDLDHECRLGAPVHGAGFSRHHRDQGLVPRPMGFHHPRGVHPDVASGAGEEDHAALERVSAGILDGRGELGGLPDLKRQFRRIHHEFRGFLRRGGPGEHSPGAHQRTKEQAPVRKPAGGETNRLYHGRGEPSCYYLDG